ncbi:hypothetical protein ACFW04_012939 [Cataglyphis niger]
MVYKICCRNCDASYMGQTGRQLCIRIKEHRSNINRAVSSHSVITDHRFSGNEFDWDDIRILDKKSSYRKKCISEMLYIKSQKKVLIYRKIRCIIVINKKRN